MRVFFDDPAFHIETRGGVSRSICQLAHLLAASGEAEVHLFGGWSRNVFLQELRGHERLRVHRLPRPARLRINGLARTFSSAWRRVVARQVFRSATPTVYHGSFYPLDPRIARAAGATVCSMYDMIPELFPEGGRSWKRYQRDKIQASRLADRIISISHSTATDLERFFPWTAGKVSTVHLAIDPSATPRGEQPPAAPPATFFMMVGQRSGYKNGPAAFRAFAALAARHPALQLVLCGGTSNDDEAALWRELGIQDRIKSIRPDNASLRTHYESALGLVYPSRYEGFGLPVLEAMAFGCPVVASGVSSLPEVGGDVALYAQPDDVDGFAAKMEALLDPTLRTRLAAAGRERALVFSEANLVAGTLECYRHALNKAR